jgi:hypothetical protein
LRQEYNALAARIDTLVRLSGEKPLEQLAAHTPRDGLVPEGFEVVLIFWADDEAEIFLNDYRISDTRLTPVEVVIPALYLQERNRLQAHCWDTDRVESGFMAGLYLRDQRGGLRQILVTEEGRWWTEGAPAEERFYTHTQPDIPGAKVIWGPRMFGSVRLETWFDAADVRQAVRRRPQATALPVRERFMQTHEVVSLLVQLEQRREELETALELRRYGVVPVRYQGYLRQRLAFTLGSAGPLAEARSSAAASQLHAWAEALPPTEQELIFGPRRSLKGVDAATPEDFFEGGSEGESERRADYQPPPERGPIQGIGIVGERRMGLRPVLPSRLAVPWVLLGMGVALVLYLGVLGRQWWRLFTGKVWKG